MTTIDERSTNILISFFTSCNCRVYGNDGSTRVVTRLVVGTRGTLSKVRVSWDTPFMTIMGLKCQTPLTSCRANYRPTRVQQLFIVLTLNLGGYVFGLGTRSGDETRTKGEFLVINVDPVGSRPVPALGEDMVVARNTGNRLTKRTDRGRKE